ncbi:MAG: hypothetical protein ACI9IA_000666 [Enterobacterales bacterium]|jgi:hypothetical protein
MTQQSENSDADQAVAKKPKTKDPRHIITPDAFKVDETLLGLPLATPKRRGVAMIIDLLLIQQLSQVDSLILGLAIAVVLFLLSNSKGKKAVGSIRKNLFKIMALILFSYLIVIESLQYIQTKDFSFTKNDRSTQPITEEVIQKVEDDQPSLPLIEQLQIAEDKIESLESENSVLRADDDSNIIDILEAIAVKFGYGFGWAGVYFTLFCFLLNGQTPGKFLLRIKIIQLDGKKLSIWNAFGRYGGYAASVVTGLSGFFQILWDPNRQGLHDKVSGTVVIRL